MRVLLMAQEEPVYMGPFMIRLMQARAAQVVGVAVGRLRGAGSRPSGLRGRLRRLRLLWLLFEPLGLLRGLAVRVGWRLSRLLPPLDRRSLDRAARRLGIPVLPFEDPNAPAFLERLRELAPDVIFNQADCILGAELLSIPTIGVINRHGSRLPRHRGRLASFYTHAEGTGEGWITVHFVDERIDAGGIILQRSFVAPSTASYARVLDALFDSSLDPVLEALDRLEDPTFEPQHNDIAQGTLNKMPTLAQVQAYRRQLAEIRRRG